jgi:hypothetical protein
VSIDTFQAAYFSWCQEKPHSKNLLTEMGFEQFWDAQEKRAQADKECTGEDDDEFGQQQTQQQQPHRPPEIEQLRKIMTDKIGMNQNRPMPQNDFDRLKEMCAEIRVHDCTLLDEALHQIYDSLDRKLSSAMAAQSNQIVAQENRIDMQTRDMETKLQQLSDSCAAKRIDNCEILHGEISVLSVVVRDLEQKLQSSTSGIIEDPTERLLPD